MGYNWVPIDKIDRVVQRRVSPVDGDCMQACIASLLRIPIEEVPSFHPEARKRGEPWAYDWLLERGMFLEFTHRMDDGSYQRTPEDVGIPPGYTMASVPSALYPGKGHSVIALDGVVVWDPSPHAAERNLPYDPIEHYARLYYTGD